jgi:hypothetical protein
MKRLLLIFILFMSYFSIGQISFYKTYTGSVFDEGQGITQLPDSSYAVTGSSGAFSSTSGQAYLMLVDSLGDHLWTKSYGGAGSDWGRRVFHKPGVGFVIAGYTNTTDDGSFNFYLIETDESGELISEKNFGTSNWERLWDAVMLSDEGFLLVGETEGATSELKDMYIVRTDDQGDTLWTKTISTQYDDIAYAVTIVNDTTVAIGGDSWENDEPRSTILNMHINGDINWQTYYGDTVETGIRDLEYFDNGLYAGGYIVPLGKVDWDIWALRTDMNGAFVNDLTQDFQGTDFLSSIVVKSLISVYFAICSDSPEYGVFPEGTDAFVSKFDAGFFYKNFSESFSGVNPDIVYQMINTIDDGIAFIGTCADDRVSPSMGSEVMIVKIGPNDEVVITAEEDNDLVSLSVFSKDENFKVYPNPTANKLIIPEKLIGDKYSIYNSLGKEVQRGNLDASLDVSYFNSGIYHIKVLHNNNYSTVRIVKK